MAADVDDLRDLGYRKNGRKRDKNHAETATSKIAAGSGPENRQRQQTRRKGQEYTEKVDRATNGLHPRAKEEVPTVEHGNPEQGTGEIDQRPDDKIARSETAELVVRLHCSESSMKNNEQQQMEPLYYYHIIWRKYTELFTRYTISQTRYSNCTNFNKHIPRRKKTREHHGRRQITSQDDQYTERVNRIHKQSTTKRAEASIIRKARRAHCITAE